MCSNHIQKIPCIFNLFQNTYNQSFGVFDARRYVSSNESQIAWQVSAKIFPTVDLSILNTKLKLFCDIPVARNPSVNSSFSSANMPFLNDILFNFSSSSSDKSLLNPFSANVPLLYPLKTSENLRFSDVFRGYRVEYWLKIG